MLAAVTSSPLLTNSGENVFRITATSTQGTDAVFSYATKVKNLKSFAILYEEADYPRPQAERFKALAAEKNIPITAYETLPQNETDFRSILIRVQKSKPEGLYIATLSPDTAALLLKQLQELHFKAPVFGNENTGHTVASLGEQKSLFDNIIFASSEYDKNEEHAKKFREKYLARFKTTELPYGPYTAEAYDSVRLLSELIGKCGDSISEIKSCLHKVKNYAGASGTFSIDANGDSTRAYEMQIVRNGQIAKLVD